MNGETTDITIIGAGVIGLAIADELSSQYDNLVVLEKNNSYGQETSSRAGEIIHSGLYFPSGFFKGDFCRPGNRALYNICAERKIPHKRLGKIIISTDNDQTERLEKIKQEGEQNGVDDLSFLSQKQLRSLEPDVKADVGLFSPSTGIIDSHKLMYSFLKTAASRNAIVVYRSKVTAIDYDGSYYVVEVNGGEYRFKTRVLINSTGLYSDYVAALVGIDTDKLRYRIHYSKGSFFSTSQALRLQHLLWPVNVQKGKKNKQRGIHTDVDLGGAVKFGPHWEHVDDIDYAIDKSLKTIFYESISRYLPGVTMESLHPSMSGIRPQLQGPNDPYRDFVIADEADIGYPGLINLIGIECPGLTDCIPIAHYVASLVLPYV